MPRQTAWDSLWTHSCSSLECRAATRALAPGVYELEERPLAGVRHLPWHSPGPVTSPGEGRRPQETSACRAQAITEVLNPGRAPGARGLHSRIEGSPCTAPTTDRSAGPGGLGLNFCSRARNLTLNQPSTPANLEFSRTSEFHIPPEITENRNSVRTRCSVSDRTTNKTELPAA